MDLIAFALFCLNVSCFYYIEFVGHVSSFLNTLSSDELLVSRVLFFRECNAFIKIRVSRQPLCSRPRTIRTP